VDAPPGASAPSLGARARAHLRWLAAPAAGLAGLIGLWWLGGFLISSNPRLHGFAGFAPQPALAALVDLVVSGDAWRAAWPSLWRVLQGLLAAFLIGMPVGITVGLLPTLERATQLPFQILRMVSPLAWMPIAIMAFPTWDGAIVFLIAAAAVWPVLFATAAGVKRIDPAWLAVGRTLGGRGFQLVRVIVVRAVAPDILTGFRLALGIAWVVLVPAEFLGVTSGLGYAINDARDTLEYDRLAALVVLIGLIGFVLDAFAAALLARTRWTPTA
jgi:NitT/TauT family transport system permease protein